MDLALNILQSQPSMPRNLPAQVGAATATAEKNNPVIALIRSQRISRCHGCNVPIDVKQLPCPYDMLFKVIGHKTYPHPKTGQPTETTGALYFHLKKPCIAAKGINLDDVTMEDRDFGAIGPVRMKLLYDLGYLQKVLRNRQDECKFSFFSGTSATTWARGLERLPVRTADGSGASYLVTTHLQPLSTPMKFALPTKPCNWSRS